MEENKSLLEQIVTLLLKILDILTGNLKPKEDVVMKADWSNDEWTKITLEAIEKLGPDLLAAESLSDADFYGYHPKSLDEKKQFWLMLLSSMARFESSFKPEAQHKENFKDSTGEFVISRGLFQLSFESVKGYGVRLSKPEDLHDPKTNIEAAVVILNRWVGRDRAIGYGQGTSTFGGARYWSVLRESSDKRSQIAAKTKALGTIEKEPTPQEPGLFRNKAILLQAEKAIGTKEVPGSGNNPLIVEMHAYSTKENKGFWPDSLAWCASAAAWVLEKAGLGSTNSKMARSYEGWGVAVKDFKDWLPGDIVTRWRDSKSSGLGHVHFFVKWLVYGKSYYAVGGNQDDEFNISIYQVDQYLVGARRSSKAGEYSEAQKDELWEIADRLVDTYVVKQGGKVS